MDISSTTINWVNYIQNFFDLIKDIWWWGLVALAFTLIYKYFYKYYRKRKKIHRNNNPKVHKCSIKTRIISNYYGECYLWHWEDENKTFFVDKKLIEEEIESHTSLITEQINASGTEDNLTPENSVTTKFSNENLTSLLKKICEFNRTNHVLYLQKTLFQFIKTKLQKSSITINLKIDDEEFSKIEFKNLNGDDFGSENNISFSQ